MRVSSKLTTSGPIKIPIGPRSEIPPSTEKRIKNGGIFILLPTRIGFRTLSTVPTKIADHANRPIAGIICPVAKRKIIPGTVTSAVPKDGIKELIPATRPQSAGLGTLKIMKPIDTRAPCINPINK